MDDAARRRLFEEHQRWAVRIANAWRVPKPMRDDAQAAALAGLWDACIKHTGEGDFVNYAHIRIRGAIMDACRSYDRLTRRHRLNVTRGTQEDVHFAVFEDELYITAEESPEDFMSRKEEFERLEAAMEQLPKRLRTLMQEHYVHGRKFCELTEMAVSQPRISQLHDKALRLLRAALATRG